MPLVIEDGTGVVGANSYITVDELRAYALDRGIAFPAAVSSGTDPAIAIFTPYLILACDYLQSKQTDFSGYPLFPGVQPLVFPRGGIWPVGMGHYAIYADASFELPPIPLTLKAAQAQLVIEQMSGIALAPTQAAIGVGVIPAGVSGIVEQSDGRFIIREKLDVIETQWSENIGTVYEPIMPAVEALLRPLCYSGSQFYSGVRV